MKNIILVGFMGTGKTRVAKEVARELGKVYASSDELIVERESKAIKDIFQKEGEAYFRSVEKEIIREISEKTDLVVDTGGGVVLDEENIKLLNEQGIVVCLWADEDTICERTKGSGERPLLNVDDPKKKIRELLEYRRSFYEKARYHVDTTGLDIQAVTKEVLGIVKKEESIH